MSIPLLTIPNEASQLIDQLNHLIVQINALAGSSGGATINTGNSALTGIRITNGLVNSVSTIPNAVGVLTNDGLGNFTYGTGGGAVASVSNSDTTLTISPTTGAVIASLNLGATNTWTAPINSSYVGTASTPALGITGALYTTGSTTTNTPLFYMNGSVNAPTTWSSLGTYIGVNAQAGGIGNFLDFHVNGGVSAFSVGSTGSLSTTGSINTSRPGALSAASVNITGAAITGGTTTTCFPLVYINDGTAPTTWNTGGTILGINAQSGFAGNFFDLHLNGGVSLFSVSSLGVITTASNITSAGLINSTRAGTTSNGAMSLTGTWVTGGTGTTSFPQFKIEPSTATAVTTWNTNGTAIGINTVSGFTGNFLDFYVNGGTSAFSVSSAGTITLAGNITAGVNTIIGGTGYNFNISGGACSYGNSGNNNATVHTFASANQSQSNGADHLDFQHTANFNPSAGASPFYGMSLLYTINQTGTASGGYTAFRINVTETAVLGTTKLLMDLQKGSVSQTTINNTGIISRYNTIVTAGLGVPVIVAAGRATAQVAANASVATYTVGAADGSFDIVANVLVTTSTLHNFTVTCSYTDEGNTARILTLQFSNLAGTFLTAIANAAGAVPYEGVAVSIRAKAATAITISSAAGGTYTTVTYNIEGFITQKS